MENSLAKLDRAVTAAAKASGLSTTQGATLAGAWQWVWHPLRNSEDSRRIEVLATPDEYGVQVAVQALVWRNSTRRQTKRQTYFSHFYSNEIGWEKLAEDIQEPLKKALKELPNTKL